MRCGHWHARHRHLGEEIADLEQRMLNRATANPGLLAIKGIAPSSAPSC